MGLHEASPENSCTRRHFQRTSRALNLLPTIPISVGRGHLGEGHSGELGLPRKYVKITPLSPTPQSRDIAIRHPSLKYLLWGPTFLASNIVHFCTRHSMELLWGWSRGQGRRQVTK